MDDCKFLKERDKKVFTRGGKNGGRREGASQKVLRLAERFQVNHTRYVAFCENLSNNVKTYRFERLFTLYPSLNLRK